MKLVIRLDHEIQSTIACMLIKVDHAFDFELLNRQRKDKYSQLQTYCQAGPWNKSQGKHSHLCYQDEKKLLPWVLRKGALCDNDGWGPSWPQPWRRATSLWVVPCAWAHPSERQTPAPPSAPLSVVLGFQDTAFPLIFLNHLCVIQAMFYVFTAY